MAFGQKTAELSPEPFSIAVADRVLGAFRDAILAHDRSHVLALFDRDRMPSYSEFAANLGPFFDRYESLRVRYHILQVSEEANTAVVEVTLEAATANSGPPPVRHDAPVRFSFEPAGKDWKIAATEPGDVFAGFWNLP
jgi:hypothetical protein